MLTQDNLANASPLGKSGGRATVADTWPERVQWLMDKHGGGDRAKTGKLFGVSAEMVRQYLAGQEPGLDKLAAALRNVPGLSAWWLVTGERPREAAPGEPDERAGYRKGVEDATGPIVSLVREVRRRAALDRTEEEDRGEMAPRRRRQTPPSGGTPNGDGP